MSTNVYKLFICQ